MFKLKERKIFKNIEDLEVRVIVTSQQQLIVAEIKIDKI